MRSSYSSSTIAYCRALGLLLLPTLLVVASAVDANDGQSIAELKAQVVETHNKIEEAYEMLRSLSQRIEALEGRGSTCQPTDGQQPPLPPSYLAQPSAPEAAALPSMVSPAPLPPPPSPAATMMDRPPPPPTKLAATTPVLPPAAALPEASERVVTPPPPFSPETQAPVDSPPVRPPPPSPQRQVKPDAEPHAWREDAQQRETTKVHRPGDDVRLRSAPVESASHETFDPEPVEARSPPERLRSAGRLSDRAVPMSELLADLLTEEEDVPDLNRMVIEAESARDDDHTNVSPPKPLRQSAPRMTEPSPVQASQTGGDSVNPYRESGGNPHRDAAQVATPAPEKNKDEERQLEPERKRPVPLKASWMQPSFFRMSDPPAEAVDQATSDASSEAEAVGDRVLPAGGDQPNEAGDGPDSQGESGISSYMPSFSNLKDSIASAAASASNGARAVGDKVLPFPTSSSSPDEASPPPPSPPASGSGGIGSYMPSFSNLKDSVASAAASASNGARAVGDKVLPFPTISSQPDEASQPPPAPPASGGGGVGSYMPSFGGLKDKAAAAAAAVTGVGKGTAASIYPKASKSDEALPSQSAAATPPSGGGGIGNYMPTFAKLKDKASAAAAATMGAASATASVAGSGTQSVGDKIRGRWPGKSATPVAGVPEQPENPYRQSALVMPPRAPVPPTSPVNYIPPPAPAAATTASAWAPQYNLHSLVAPMGAGGDQEAIVFAQNDDDDDDDDDDDYDDDDGDNDNDEDEQPRFHSPRYSQHVPNIQYPQQSPALPSSNYAMPAASVATASATAFAYSNHHHQQDVGPPIMWPPRVRPEMLLRLQPREPEKRGFVATAARRVKGAANSFLNNRIVHNIVEKTKTHVGRAGAKLRDGARRAGFLKTGPPQLVPTVPDMVGAFPRVPHLQQPANVPPHLYPYQRPPMNYAIQQW